MARVRVLSNTSICHPTLVLTVCLWCPLVGCFVWLAYHASVPYRADGITHVRTTLRSATTGGPSLILARLQM
jgi:hypothetical protein